MCAITNLSVLALSEAIRRYYFTMYYFANTNIIHIRVVSGKTKTMHVPGLKWVPSSIHGPIPSTAISCGKDRDGSEIYVGLAHHLGDQLPVKVVPRRREAYISYNGKEIKVTNFQLLVQSSPRWILSSSGQIPAGAVPAGMTRSGERLYAGRVSLGGNAYAVGKIHPSHGVLYIPYDGKEQAHTNYEILIIDS